MTEVFLKNRQALASRFAGLDSLTPRLPPDLLIQPAATGEPTVRYRGRWIHSVYDPRKEAATFAAEIKPGTRLCLYGFGLGYTAEAVLERLGPDGALLVLELNPDLLAAALQSRDLTPLAGDPRFHLVFAETEDQAAACMAQGMSWLDPGRRGTPEIRFHPPSWECLPPGFGRIANALEVLRLERRVPVLFGDLESRNFALNREALPQTRGIKALKNRHRGQPALLISAGPSLDGLLPFLPSLARRCLAGCVDTALPVVRGLGLSPDYVFTLDPQEQSFSHFEDHLDCTASLVFTPTANPRVIQQYQGPKVVVFKEQQTATRHETRLEQEKGTTRAGGSVSCLGLDCLIQMGCDPIVLVGQDCAFPGLRGYARGADARERNGVWASPGQSSADAQKDHARRHKPVAVEGCNGSEVITSPVLFSYLRTLEQILKAHPGTQVLNLASHGARIPAARSIGSINELLTVLG